MQIVSTLILASVALAFTFEEVHAAPMSKSRNKGTLKKEIENAVKGTDAEYAPVGGSNRKYDHVDYENFAKQPNPPSLYQKATRTSKYGDHQIDPNHESQFSKWQSEQYGDTGSRKGKGKSGGKGSSSTKSIDSGKSEVEMNPNYQLNVNWNAEDIRGEADAAETLADFSRYGGGGSYGK